MLVDMLNEEFEIVGTVQSGSAAVDECGTTHPDILVLDVAMDDMTGYEVARRLHLAGSDTKLIYLSMFEGSGFVDSAFANGASAYVFKSQAGTELVSALRKVAHGRTLRPSGSRAKSRH